MHISKSRSYVFLLRQTDETVQAFQALGKPHNFMTCSVDSDEDFLNFIDEASDILGIILPTDAPSSIKDKISSFEEKQKLFHRATDQNVDGQKLAEDFTQHLKNLLPQGLKDLSKGAVEHVSAQLFGIEPIEFSFSTEAKNIDSVDIGVICDSLAPDFSSSIIIKCCKEKVVNTLPDVENSDFDELAAHLREFSNQILGAINFNLRNVPIEARIGLPTSLPGEDFS